MKIIHVSTIEKETTVCPYCMDDVTVEQMGCCGESSAHFERAYILTDGECYLASEVNIDEHEFESLIGV